MTKSKSSTTTSSHKLFKRGGPIRAGFHYQDLFGLKELIDFFQNPDLYEWVQIEGDGVVDDIDPGFLDDIICKRKSDNRLIVKQVKFCVDPTNPAYALNFDWLLAKRGKRGTSLINKWGSTVIDLLTQETLGEACLLTNRIPDEEIKKALEGDCINPDLLSKERWAIICREIGSEESARTFFKCFRFLHTQEMLDDLERNLRGHLVPAYTDSGGWASLLNEVHNWAMKKNEPQPDGRITYDVLKNVLSTRRPKPLSQDFYIPKSYLPPDRAFHDDFIKKMNTPGLFVLWGTPGKGKSTYLSYLVHQLRKSGAFIIRHHYFLSLDDTSGDRVSFVDIAGSLIDQMEKECAEAKVNLPSRPLDLRKWLEKCGQWSLKNGGKPFVVVIDGLDHVWRERGGSGAAQMDHLFSEILPLPINVTLIMGTQKVDEKYLPRDLLKHSKVEKDWIELPPMSAETIRLLVEAQADAGRLIAPAWAKDLENRGRWLKEMADAFQTISNGHPLHLIYSMETLVHNRSPVKESDILALPQCPDGDIRSYYGALWHSLPEVSKEILHLLAASGFNWVRGGIFQCLGDSPKYLEGWKKIQHMIEARRTMVLPFHGSILAYLTERPEHQEASARLITKVVAWLTQDAPEYWRWAWLWLSEAKAGKPRNLIDGPSREWMIESLCKGYPITQVQKIIVGSERAALEAEEYPRLVELRALEVRLLNGFEFQTNRKGEFYECALMLSDDNEIIDYMSDLLNGLDPDILVLISRIATLNKDDEIPKQAFKHAYNLLRHESEFGSHRGDKLVQYGEEVAKIGAMTDPSANKIISFAKRWKTHGIQIFKAYIDELCKLNQFERLLEIWKAPHLPEGFTNVLSKVCIQEGCRHNISLELRSDLAKVFQFPLGAVYYYFKTGRPSPWIITTKLPELPPRGTVLRTEEAVVHLWEYFFADVSAILSAKGAYQLIPYPINDNTPTWLSHCLKWLQDQAHIIAGRIKSGQTVDIATLIKAGSSISRIHKHFDYDENSAFNKFCAEVRRIAVDLHSLAMAQGRANPISPENLDAIFPSQFGSRWNWFNEFKERPEYLISQKTAIFLIKTLYTETFSSLSDMSGRSETYLDLTVLAIKHNLHDLAKELLCKAANCITGYSNHKDYSVFDVLNAIEACAEENIGDIRIWLTKIATAIEAIDEYTDGDETLHAKRVFASIMAKYLPEMISSLYRHQVEQEEWSNADATLAEAFEHIDLSQIEALALAGTIENPEVLAVINKRAEQGSASASRIVEERKRMFGDNYFTIKDEFSDATSNNIGGRNDHASLLRPVDFPPKHLNEFILEVKSKNIIGEKSLREWLDYWVQHGQGMEAIANIEEIVKAESYYEVEYLFDHIFEIVLKLKGKDEAYPWIVRAHIQQSGWSEFYSGKEKCRNRLRRVSEVYPDRWRKYVRDVSAPRWKISTEGSIVMGRDMFVRFLLLVGERKLALSITETMIDIYLSELADQPIGFATWLEK